MKSALATSDYRAFLTTVKERVLHAHTFTAQTVNRDFLSQPVREMERDPNFCGRLSQKSHGRITSIFLDFFSLCSLR